MSDRAEPMDSANGSTGNPASGTGAVGRKSYFCYTCNRRIQNLLSVRKLKLIDI